MLWIFASLRTNASERPCIHKGSCIHIWKRGNCVVKRQENGIKLKLKEREKGVQCQMARAIPEMSPICLSQWLSWLFKAGRFIGNEPRRKTSQCDGSLKRKRTDIAQQMYFVLHMVQFQGVLFHRIPFSKKKKASTFETDFLFQAQKGIITLILTSQN